MTDQKRALILVTNDDGIASPGLLAAVKGVLDLGDVWVIAPRVQQSGVGRSFPYGEVHAQQGFFTVDGAFVPSFAMDTSPAKAVRHGLLRFLPRMPDVAVAGINYGENVGACITISGTIGAAIEAASFGIPTLAASLQTDQKYHFSHSVDVDFAAAAVFVRLFVSALLRQGMPRGVDILNLNVPHQAQADTPWRATRVSRQEYFVTPVTVDECGLKQVSGYVREVDFSALEPDSDIHALLVAREVSVSPLTVDLTAQVDLRSLQDALSVRVTCPSGQAPNPEAS